MSSQAVRSERYSMCVYIVTGSTRGIGFGLARELLTRGQKVVVNGRAAEKVAAAVAALKEHASRLLGGFADNVAGCEGDVASKPDMKRLFDFGVATFGKVDCWICNAAVSPGEDLTDISPEAIAETLATNVAGTLHGCQVAMAGMKAQAEGGRIYFVEGLGSDGRHMSSSSAVYGCSKYCNAYLAAAFEADLAAQKITKVRIGRLQPGMVITDLLLARYKRDPAGRAQFKKICNILAEPESTVTPWLADGLIRQKLLLRYLTAGSVVGRFLSAPFKQRDLFEHVDRELAAAEDGGEGGGVGQKKGEGGGWGSE
jgi:NAD(P)-dependent dehydrogenase (short-subunit alcohol dehydrogenase family)